MFDIGWAELVVLGLVILVVLGPKEIPAVLRSIGRFTGQIRRLAFDFQRNLEKMDVGHPADLLEHLDSETPIAKASAKQKPAARRHEADNTAPASPNEQDLFSHAAGDAADGGDRQDRVSSADAVKSKQER